ncbi:MAG TPA: hypothetical protein ENJ20_06540 [Bacteroidetes bacterium]|nr:hypothetical protein [Bacteroidota bacterium]
MKKTNIRTLRKKLHHPTDWDDSIMYFLNVFPIDKKFWERSKKVHIPVFESMVGEVCIDIFKKETVRLIGMSMYRIKEFKLVHGSCYVEKKIILFFYFTDIHRGVLAVITPAGGLVHSTRITALPPEDMENVQEIYEDFPDGRMN